MNASEVIWCRDNIGGSVRFVAVSATASPCLEADPKRIAITFTPDKTGRITVSTDPSVTDGNGILVLSTTGPVSIDIEHYGLLLSKQWFAVGSAGGLQLGIITGDCAVL